MKKALLIVDPQFDFCNPAGNLYVEGAVDDMKRLASWIRKNKNEISHITITMDNHHVNDISHPSFWQDMSGNFPAPFTEITALEIVKGTWMPRFFPDEAQEYVEKLEKQGEFKHFIWPYHCLIGSKGASVDDRIMDALVEWTRDGKYYNVITKGTLPLTEHFGVFRANIPIKGRPETQINRSLIQKLLEFDEVYLAGEARSHCVANSLKQAMEDAPRLASKFIILKDCMSDVTGMGYLGDPIFDRARKIGIRFETSNF